MTILDEIAAYAQQRVQEAARVTPLSELKSQAESVVHAEQGVGVADGVCSALAFEASLRAANARGDIAFICECKKASPSKGVIAEDFPYLNIAKEYSAAGADAISVLTEPKWFLGSSEYLRQIAAAVPTPCLRKDFVVDPYQIYEAKLLGAKAVLLICSILSENKLNAYLQLCGDLHLSALVEVHDADEMAMALRSGARIIGVNNRNLKDFSVNTDNSKRLRDLVPSDKIFVAESGVHSASDVAALREIGVNAVLVGESLMRATDKKAKLAELRGH